MTQTAEHSRAVQTAHDALEREAARNKRDVQDARRRLQDTMQALNDLRQACERLGIRLVESGSATASEARPLR